MRREREEGKGRREGKRRGREEGKGGKEDRKEEKRKGKGRGKEGKEPSSSLSENLYFFRFLNFFFIKAAKRYFSPKREMKWEHRYGSSWSAKSIIFNAPR